ncbi:hypothetical protein BDR05DRAFT_1006298 [Suillus weaverae]|nr:hypothetical protein BDR05DRAFT_1006298 [Suillus weaverae]
MATALTLRIPASLSAALPPGPLSLPPCSRSVRPRSGSFDDPSYLIAPPQTPSKRPCNKRGDYDHMTTPLPPCHTVAFLTSISTPNTPAAILAASVRATSQDIADLLLDAATATDERSALNAGDRQPQ